jgi:hypothetical protein
MTVEQAVNVAPHQKAQFSRVVPAWFAPQLDTSERMTKQQAALMAKVTNGTGDETMMTVLQSPAPVFSLGFTRTQPGEAPKAPDAPPPSSPAVGLP